MHYAEATKNINLITDKLKLLHLQILRTVGDFSFLIGISNQYGAL